MLLEFTEQQKIQRGQEAEELLANPLLVEAFNVIRQRIVSDMLACDDRDMRDELWSLNKSLDAVGAHLGTVMKTGQLLSLDRRKRKTMLEKLSIWATE